MKLSIIIPVYNAEQFIARCIESIYKGNPLHTSDFEVICVNDGSTDGSKHVLERLSACYSNLRVIHKTNGGPGAARNRGILNAKGEYIYFVDSDDTINPRCLCISLREVEKHQADLGVLGYNLCSENDNGKIAILRSNSISNTFQLPEKNSTFVSPSDLISSPMYQSFSWSFLFSRDVIENNNLTYPKLHYMEDEYFVLNYITLCARILPIDQITYNYIVRDDSASRPISSEQRIRNIRDSLYVVKNMDEITDKVNNECLKQCLVNRLNFVRTSIVCSLLKLDVSPRQKLSFLMSLDDDKMLPGILYGSYSMKYKIVSRFLGRKSLIYRLPVIRGFLTRAAN